MLPIKLLSGSLAGFVLSVAICGFAASFGLFGKAHPPSSDLDHRSLGVGVLHDARELEAGPRIPAIMVRVHSFGSPTPTKFESQRE